MSILAIDPGNTESGYALIDPITCRPIEVDIIPNKDLLDRLIKALDDGRSGVHHVVIEMVASYGMPVGKEVFETCVWIGRFAQVVEDFKTYATPCDLIYRKNVKLHLCHTTKAKDSNITQALIDRFASGQPNRGKGTKADPGWFYGFKADIWQAYALAVLTADTTNAADVAS
jgi:hypothetical protein